jgi:heat shock protein HtpX
LGIALGVKALRMYPTRVFPAFNVSGLLASVKVSAVRPVPCTLRGKIIGRGVPGLIWSEDFVMQDDTGIIVLDYRQPLAIWQWLFGLLKAGMYQGREVTVTGWYRRSPTPFVEIYRLQADGSRKTCYAYYAHLAVAVLALVAGAVLIALPWFGF